MLDSKQPDWWRGAVIYQIYPRSFFDSDNNGVGDLKGITSKLDYVADLGVDAIWISPFFKSPMQDFGYDVQDFRDVDPLFGNLSDFRELLAKAHALGLRVLIDLVISHTSEQHDWFVQSRQDRNNPKADWYVWADASATGNPPNNWLSLFGGSAWQWDVRRSQYYLHNFLVSQPDLNFHHPQVRNAVLDEARFWLDLGVDGFRLDVVNFYFHDQGLRSNPPAPSGIQTNTVERSNPYSYQSHLFDKTQPENLEFLESFRSLMNEYPGTAMVGELGVDVDVALTSKQYTQDGKRLHMVYSFDLLGKDGSPAYLRRVIEAMEADIGSGWVSWALTNHDFERIVSRWGFESDRERATPLLLALLCSLRGSPCIYQGDELGLTQADVPFERMQDPYGKAFWPSFKGRDGCRTPIAWQHNADHGGFSHTDPWLPVAQEHQRVAVDVQASDDSSPLRRVQTFLRWRAQHRALSKGTMHVVDSPAGTLAIQREHQGQEILAVFNLQRKACHWALNAEGWQPVSGHGFDFQFGINGLQIEPLGAAFLARQNP